MRCTVETKKSINLLEPSVVDEPVGLLQTGEEIAIDDTSLNGIVPQPANYLTAVNQLAADTGATTAVEAQPDRRTAEQFIRQAQVNHSKHGPRVEHASFAGNRTSTAALSAGKARCGPRGVITFKIFVRAALRRFKTN